MPRVKPQLYLDAVAKILDPRFRELAPEEGARGFTGFEVKGVDEDRRTVTALVSSASVDRYGEIVLPEAFAEHLDRFMANPVLVAGHAYGTENGDPTVIGQWTDLKITSEGLIGTALFMHDDELAEKYFKRYVQKAMRAFSVGFLTRAYEMRDHKMSDGRTQRIRVFTEVELIEISCVTIPANRDAVVRGPGADRNPSNRTIERVIREEIGRQLRADSPAMKQMIADVMLSALEVLAKAERGGSSKPWYDEYWRSMRSIDAGEATDRDDDEYDDEDQDEDDMQEEEEMSDEDKSLIEELRDVLR